MGRTRNARRKSQVNVLNLEQNIEESQMPIIDRMIDLNNDHVANQRVNFHLESFDGDPSRVKWFVNQVKEISRINKWSDQVSILFLKSKLTGSAQTWCSNAPCCTNLTSLDEFCEKLLDFFSQKTSPDIDLKAFQACTIGPDETVKNFAFRLEVLAHKAYPFLSSEVMNEIKTRQFLSAIPRQVKNSLSEIDKINFYDLVKKVENTYECPMTSHSNAIRSEVSKSENSDIEQLRLQVEFLTTAVTENISTCQICYKQKHPMQQCEVFKNMVKIESPRDQSVCAFCNKVGHHMAICYHYKNSLSQNNPDRRNTPVQSYSSNFSQNQGFRPNSYQAQRFRPSFSQSQNVRYDINNSAQYRGFRPQTHNSSSSRLHRYQNSNVSNRGNPRPLN